MTITNNGTQLEIVSVNQNDGWQIEIEVASGREVEVDFSSGTRRIQFNAEFEDGEIRVRAREGVITATTQATTSTTQGSTASTVAVSEQGTVTYEAGAAGSVTISNDGSQLTIVDVNAADGWSHEIEVQVGREVEMDFRNGEERVQFNAELEDGEVRVRVRTRTADGTRTEVTNGVDTTDDSGSRSDDNSSKSSSSSDDSNDSDDDNSGQGGSSDDTHDDDHGGRGSSPDDHDDDDSSDD